VFIFLIYKVELGDMKPCTP